MPPRIYLTGFMGCGKSTVGAALAERLGYAFVDLDDWIVARIGMPIADYFKREGEPAFRRVESEALQDSAALEQAVIAVGGGALVSERNLMFAREHGEVIYLRVDQNEIVRRLRAEQHTRPMLLDEHGRLLPDEGVLARIRRLWEAREPYYRRAHQIVDLSGFGVEAAAARLLEAVGGVR